MFMISKDSIKRDLVTAKRLCKNAISRDKYIILKSCVWTANGKIVHHNWGDDMNYYLAEILSGKKVMILPKSALSQIISIKSYLVIGSTISFFPLDHVTIWGTGIINNYMIKNIHGIPDKICAVRGPLTRKALLNRGYDCPEVYGDPVLLLPKFYNPNNIEKKYEYGVIPHYIDKEMPGVQKLGTQGAHIIDVQKYSHWHDFVNEIISCKYIISSSLHGLIVSEAYGIPSVWVGFSKYINGWDFKFFDYYASINKTEERIIMVDNDSGIATVGILNKLHNWQQSQIDTELLLSACPFYNNSKD